MSGGFLGMPGTQFFTTTDAVLGTSGQPLRIYSVNLTSGGGNSTVKFYNGTSTGGNLYLQLDGVAGMGVSQDFSQGIRFPSGCWVDVDSNCTGLSVSYVQEF